MRGKAQNKRRAPHNAAMLIRWVMASAAAAVLALFVYTYLARGLSSNTLLAVLAKTQFSGALYGGVVCAVVAAALCTLVFGRLYCSVLCPLGTLQEWAWRAGNLFRTRLKKKPASHGYTRLSAWRFVVPLVTGAGVALSVSLVMAALDPISTFGRGMNAVRSFAFGATGAGLLLAVPMALVLAAAWFCGRAFCSWCPVGIALGVLSRAAPLKMRVKTGCTSCGVCEKHCPAQCIDSRQKRIEFERCVLCFSCAAVCPARCIQYGGRGARPSANAACPENAKSVTRRAFLKSSAYAAASASCAAVYFLGAGKALFRFAPKDAHLGGGAVLGGANLVIMPPGAGNARHYRSRCVGCYACASSCPVGVIKAAAGIAPALDYTTASCQFDCVECSLVCPTGAIKRLTVDQKHTTRIALSSLDFARCVVNTKGESCGACAEVCPTHSLRMVPYAESGIPWLTKPVFDEAYCVGCGACLVACPARPNAFAVAPVAEQTRTPGMRPADDSEKTLVYEPTEDFPF